MEKCQYPPSRISFPGLSACLSRYKRGRWVAVWNTIKIALSRSNLHTFFSSLIKRGKGTRRNATKSKRVPQLFLLVDPSWNHPCLHTGTSPTGRVRVPEMPLLSHGTRQRKKSKRRSGYPPSHCKIRENSRSNEIHQRQQISRPERKNRPENQQHSTFSRFPFSTVLPILLTSPQLANISVVMSSSLTQGAEGSMHLYQGSKRSRVVGAYDL